MTVSSLCLMGSKILTGFLYDKTGLRITMNISLACTFLSLGGLVILSNTQLGQVIALVRILFAAVALPLETVMIPFFAADLFGNKDFTKILGIFTAANTAGFSLGAPFANLCYDLFGDYNVSFIAFAVLMLFVTVTMQLVLRTAHRDRGLILAAESVGSREA
jgi:MFS family permease